MFLPTLSQRLGLGLIVLVVEWIALSLLIDTGRFGMGREWWAIVIRKGPVITQVAIATLTVMAVGVGWSLRQHRRDRTTPELGWAAAQIACFVAFLAIARMISSPEFRQQHDPGRWVAGGIVLAAGTIALWCRAVLPQMYWDRAARVAGVTLLAAAPIGVATWAAGRLVRSTWDVLPEATLRLTERLLMLTGHTVICQPDQRVIGAEQFLVTVSEDCSGYQGIGLIWLFLIVYLWLFREQLRFPFALLLLPLGTVAVYLMNAVRIAALVLVGVHISPTIALEAFHSQAGWIAFDAVGIGLVLVAQRMPLLRFGRPESSPKEGAPAGNATAAFVLPFLALLASSMLVGAFTENAQPWYPLRIVAASAVLLTCLSRYELLLVRPSWRGPALGVVTAGIWLLLEPADTFSKIGTLQEPVGADWPPVRVGLWWAWRLIGTIVVIPIAEELAFRGYLYRRMHSLEFESVDWRSVGWPGIVGSALAFGSLHPGHMVVGTAAGFLLGWAVRGRGGLTDAVIAHAVANAVIAAVALATGWHGLLV